MKTNVSTARKNLAKSSESRIRNFSAYLKDAILAFEAANLDSMYAELANLKNAAKEAAKDAKKADASSAAKEAAAEAAKMLKSFEEHLERVQSFDRMNPYDAEYARTITQGTGLRSEDLTPAFLRTFLPVAFNADGKICDIARVKVEDIAAAKEDASRDIFEDEDGTTKERKVVKLWTAAKLLQKFAAAARERKRLEKYENQAAKEAAEAAKRKAVEDDILAKADVIRAKREQAAKDAEILNEAAKEAAKDAESK